MNKLQKMVLWFAYVGCIMAFVASIAVANYLETLWVFIAFMWIANYHLLSHNYRKLREHLDFLIEHTEDKAAKNDGK